MVALCENHNRFFVGARACHVGCKLLLSQVLWSSTGSTWRFFGESASLLVLAMFHREQLRAW